MSLRSRAVGPPGDRAPPEDARPRTGPRSMPFPYGSAGVGRNSGRSPVWSRRSYVLSRASRMRSGRYPQGRDPVSSCSPRTNVLILSFGPRKGTYSWRCPPPLRQAPEGPARGVLATRPSNSSSISGAGPRSPFPSSGEARCGASWVRAGTGPPGTPFPSARRCGIPGPPTGLSRSTSGDSRRRPVPSRPCCTSKCGGVRVAGGS